MRPGRRLEPGSGEARWEKEKASVRAKVEHPFLRLKRVFGYGKAKRRCTLLVVWYAEQDEPWIILTDLPPREVGINWYALRFWIELGFKAIKSVGWQWDKTRHTDPTRISRHWLVLSVATLMELAYGTRVEDAHDRGIAPSNLRSPPKALASNHRDPRNRPARTVSVSDTASTGSGACCLKDAFGYASGCCPNPGHNPNSTWRSPIMRPRNCRYIPLSGGRHGLPARPR